MFALLTRISCRGHMSETIMRVWKICLHGNCACTTPASFKIYSLRQGVTNYVGDVAVALPWLFHCYGFSPPAPVLLLPFPHSFLALFGSILSHLDPIGATLKQPHLVSSPPRQETLHHMRAYQNICNVLYGYAGDIVINSFQSETDLCEFTRSLEGNIRAIHLSTARSDDYP